MCVYSSVPQCAVATCRPFALPSHHSDVVMRLGDELNDTTGLLDLALSVLGEVAGADDDGALGDAAFAEDFAVAEREEVEDGGFVGGLVGEVIFALVGGDEGPELALMLVYNLFRSALLRARIAG